ncbi:MAG: outer membrane protein assembly factor BamA [bacterium]|nr:outer membrane protein assembly factor BamA [bacterium]
MKKIYTILLLIFIMGTWLFAGQKNLVKKIQIEGMKNFKAGVIKDVLTTKNKKPVTQPSINKDLRAILATGYFLDAEVDVSDFTKGLLVTYTVQEKPMIEAIHFEGNDNIKRRKILAKIDMRKKEAFDNFTLSKAKKDIQNFYQELGYSNMKIDSLTKLDEQTNKIAITFYISEGKQVKIAKIILQGNTNIKTKKILKKLGLKRKKIFKEDKYRVGIQQVKQLYKEKGYLNIEVLEIHRKLDEQAEKMTLKLEIKEGPEYYIKNIQFSANTVFTDLELLEGLSICNYKNFKQSEYEESLIHIRSKYAERGYIQAQILPELIYQKPNAVLLKINIIENQVIYIDKIFINGNDITKDYVIRREFIIKENEPFNVKKVQRTQERIFNLGFFKDIQIDLDQIDEKTVDLNFNVEEQPTGMASIGAGYSSEDGLIGNLQFTKKNLLGRGQKLSLLWEFGKTKQNYQISFTEPYFFGSFISLGVDIFDINRERDYVYKNDSDGTSTDIYSEEHKGGSIRFGRRFWENYRANIGYGFDRVRVYNVDADTDTNHLELIEEQDKGYQDTSSISLSLSRDTRNNVFYTQSGSYARIKTKLAGTDILGGDNNFVKNSLEYSKFFPLFWKFVLAINAETAMINHFYPSGNSPIYEKFFIGGSESVRGYDYRGDIGPEDGGRYKFVYNIEYKFPLYQEKKTTILQGALFCDVGGAWKDGGDVTLEIGRGEYQMKAGFGLGIRFTTPAFPIRFDWGYGGGKPDGERKAQFYFTIGQLF